MKYDDATWHSGGNFPAELMAKSGATHIAMFVVWCQLNGLGGELHFEDAAEIQAIKDRSSTPGSWFLQWCDGKFTNEDVNDTGTRFTDYYYGGGGRESTGPYNYLVDYTELFSRYITAYHVRDNWATFDTIAPVIQSRFSEFIKRRK